MQHIYALYGKMGSGKDYLASLLQAHLPNNTICISFAETLKHEIENLIIYRLEDHFSFKRLSDLYRIPEKDIETIFTKMLPQDLTGVSAFKKTPQTRKLFQFYGDMRRKENENYFIDKTFERITKHLTHFQNVIITDVRFPNEYQACHDHGATLIHLNISNETRHQRLLARDGFIPSTEAENHPSETALDNIPKYETDIVIDESMSDDDMLQAILQGK